MTDADDFSELENDLRALRPVPPGAALEQRLARALAAAGPAAVTGMPWWQFLGFSRPFAAFAWGLATPVAAVAVIALLHAGAVVPAEVPAHSARPSVAATETTQAPDDFQPAEASNVLYETNDEGIVYASGQQKPARQVRYRSEDTLAWRNPKTGARVEVSYPREEVVLTPISLR